MINACIENLNELRRAVSQISNEEYHKKLDVLSNSSIGQHIRHVLEFYLCLLGGLEEGTINYDLRKRNLDIESKKSCGLETIDQIQSQLSTIKRNRPLTLEGDAGIEEAAPFSIPTNLERELAYNLEHSIHHQALIKIGLKHLNLESVLSEDFGVAPSTVRSH